MMAREDEVDEARYRRAEQALWRSYGVDPEERLVRLASTGTDVRVQVLGAGPPLLFVHGGSTCGASWAPLVARLGRFRCLVLDRPGCGLSAPLPARFDDVQRLVTFARELLPSVLDALEVQRAAAVSTSFGGLFALHAAHADPGRIDRVLEIGWPFGAPIEKVPLVMRVAAARPLAWTMTRVPPTKATVRAIFRQIGLGEALAAGRISDEAIEWFRSVLRDTDTLRNELRTNPPVITPFRGLNRDVLFPDAVLAELNVPVAFAWGTADPFGGEETARAFAARVAGARLELLPGAGHAPWMDDPDGVARSAEAFLAG
jgi:pimeloyl-ACP methyl ester carboxylesterase